MNQMTFHEADALYTLAARPVVRRHYVTHGGCKTFSLALSKFEKGLGDLAQDESWRNLLYVLKNYRFEISAAPITFNSPSLHRFSPEQIQSRFTQCRLSYPQFSQPLDALKKIFDQLRAAKENPLANCIAKLVDKGRRVGIVVKESRLIEPTEKELSTIGGKIEVLVPTQLRSVKCYDRIIVVGPARWFSRPDHIFRSPRAPVIDLVMYRWIADDWQLGPAFIGAGSPGPKTVDEESSVSEAPETAEETVLAQEAIPQAEWAHLLKPFRHLTADPSQDNVQARLLLLEGGSAVFLEAQDDATSIVIDLEADEGGTVRRLPVSEMKPGMFLLLRTVGGGDLIVPVADKILGGQATTLRSLQAEWKSKLREAVGALKYLDVSIRLLDLGSERANETNLRNWMAPRSIKTQDPKDFLALMKFAGLAASYEKYWNAMSVIDGAHRRAGATIRRMLLRQVLNTDLKTLVRSGTMTFELNEAGGGSLTAYRITDIAPELAVVPVSKIARALSQDGDQWQE